MVARSQSFAKQIKWVAVICLLLVLIEAINLLTNRSLNSFSIYPRNLSSLPYIISAPWLHGSLSHFLSNIVSLSVFAFLLLQYGKRRFIKVSIGIVVICGMLVWVFGRSAYHLGASGVVYGYFGYLVLAGVLSKKVSLILISLAIGFLYGGIIWGVLPIMPGVSWESHLFGFIAGLILAYWFRKSPLA
jgi:membrane associated rhomboid family serine protease